MSRLKATLVATMLLVGSAAPSLADRCTRVLRRMEGWTIISVTQVDGEFQGCEFGRVVRFQDGTAYQCASYGYQYAYSPDAVIFGKTGTFEGRTFLSIKTLIDGELYDMQSVALKGR